MAEHTPAELASKLARTQVFSPPELAAHMVRMLNVASHKSRPADILEPGAGAGALAEALLETSPLPLHLTLVERDVTLAEHLKDLLAEHPDSLTSDSTVHNDDFLRLAKQWRRQGRRFSHVIMNPPYGKISPRSQTSSELKETGVRVHNLFAAFMWMAADLLADNGRLVAVIPRSFLSGTQYAACREHVLSKLSVFALHHYTDRRAVFSRDDIQQEVVIVGLERARQREFIRFTSSESLTDAQRLAWLPHRRILSGREEKRVILVPDIRGGAVSLLRPEVPLLPDGVGVSVGRVVDFRELDHILPAGDGDIPLIGAEHFSARGRPTRSLAITDATKKYLHPPGLYVVARRISPAESIPRIQTKVIDAQGGSFAKGVAFENHLLVFHENHGGLTPQNAELIVRRLSDPRTAMQFNERGGTTQVNVNDIKSLRLDKE